MGSEKDRIYETYKRMLRESNREVLHLRKELIKEKKYPVKMNLPAFLSLFILAIWKVFDTLYYIVTVG